MKLRLNIAGPGVQKFLAGLLIPLMTTVNMPLAAMAAPGGPIPPAVPQYARNPKSVRLASKTVQPVIYSNGSAC